MIGRILNHSESRQEAAPLGHGLRRDRPSQRQRVQACRMPLPTMITALENETQKSMIRSFQSVRYTSFLCAFCQELSYSTTHHLVEANVAGLPFPDIPPPCRASEATRW